MVIKTDGMVVYSELVWTDTVYFVLILLFGSRGLVFCFFSDF